MCSLCVTIGGRDKHRGMTIVSTREHPTSTADSMNVAIEVHHRLAPTVHEPTILSSSPAVDSTDIQQPPVTTDLTLHTTTTLHSPLAQIDGHSAVRSRDESCTLADAIQTTIRITDTSISTDTTKTHRRQCSSEDSMYVDDDDGVEFQLNDRHLNHVHEELEKLNIATDVINKIEVQLEKARDRFRQIHEEWSKRVADIKKKYDSAIKKSRPYYTALADERRLADQAQAAAHRFERATSTLTVAKQQVKLTQDALTRQKAIEPECLEVLNHHVQRVMEAEKERLEAEMAHRQLSQQLIQCTLRVKQLAKDNSRSIRKTRHYFDIHQDYRHRLDQQKQLISHLEGEVRQKKRDYTSSLRNLERISDSIHEERSLTSTKQSGRTPESARKSASVVGLSKVQPSDVDLDTISTPEEHDDEPVDGALQRHNPLRGSSKRSGLSFGRHDSHSITSSSSSSGLSMRTTNRGSMVMPDTLPDSLLDDDEAYETTATASSSSQRHGRTNSEQSGVSDVPVSTAAPRSTGAGVILLAQRLLGTPDKSESRTLTPPREEDFVQPFIYQTQPQGIAPTSYSAPDTSTMPPPRSSTPLES